MAEERESFLSLILKEFVASGGPQVTVTIDPSGRQKDSLSAQNLVIEHGNVSKTPAALIKCLVEQKELEIEKRKFDELRLFEANVAFLRSVLCRFENNGGLLKEMSETLTSLGDTNVVNYTLESIDSKIIAGEIIDLQALLENFKCLAATFINTMTGRSDLEQVQNFLDSLIDMKKFQESIDEAYEKCLL